MIHHPVRRPVRIALAAVLALAPVALLACGSDEEEAGDTTTTAAESGSTLPTVSDVWARPGTTGGNSAIYMTISGGDEATELVGAEVEGDVAEKVELHETTTGGSMEEGSMEEGSMEGGSMEGGSMEGETTTTMGGMMNMRQVESIPVPAKGSVELKPGGYHVMLIGLTKDLKAGDTLPVTLTFEPGGTVKVTAKVREP
jgi:copper(I)-binding protein